MLLFCVFVVYQASKAYETAIEDGRRNAVRLTAISADQIELAFLAVDLTLRRVVERQHFNTMFGDNLNQDMEHNLRLWVDETPQIASILLLDAQGNINIAAFKRGYQNQISYMQHFRKHRVFQSLSKDGAEEIIIAADDTKTGRIIFVARRINQIDGSFGGIVLAAIDPTLFLNFFQSIDAGNHRLVTLMLRDGTPIFSGPKDVALQSFDILAHVQERERDMDDTDDILSETQTIHDTIQTYGIRQFKHLPLALSVVISEEDFLGEWRSARIKDISFLAIFTVFGSVLSFFALTMARQIMRVEESEAAAILASQAKSEFLANMSHELRTPLNAIIGFSEMITAGYFGELNDKQKERIHDIHLCGSHLLQLISDILEFSKGEAGKLELYEEEMDLAESIDDCSRMMSEKTRSKQIKIETRVEDSLPHMRADKRKIRQILLNLLSNATKFTPEGGHILISARRDRRQGGIVLSVSDNGIGIPENEITKALSVFGQVHRSQSHEGTGLGLPLCKMFVELHGGKLTLASKVGEGTTITMVFPADRILPS